MGRNCQQKAKEVALWVKLSVQKHENVSMIPKIDVKSHTFALPISEVKR